MKRFIVVLLIFFLAAGVLPASAMVITPTSVVEEALSASGASSLSGASPENPQQDLVFDSGSKWFPVLFVAGGMVLLLKFAFKGELSK